MNIKSCNYLSDFADYAISLKLSHANLHLQNITETDNKKIIINTESLGNRYFYVLMEHTREVTFTEKEFNRYRYQPKLFCYKKYNTTELWSLLLKINHMTSVTEFNKRHIRIFNDDIMSILNEIFILEDSRLRLNKDFIENY